MCRVITHLSVEQTTAKHLCPIIRPCWYSCPIRVHASQQPTRDSAASGKPMTAGTNRYLGVLLLERRLQPVHPTAAMHPHRLRQRGGPGQGMGRGRGGEQEGYEVEGRRWTGVAEAEEEVGNRKKEKEKKREKKKKKEKKEFKEERERYGSLEERKKKKRKRKKNLVHPPPLQPGDVITPTSSRPKKKPTAAAAKINPHRQ